MQGVSESVERTMPEEKRELLTDSRNRSSVTFLAVAPEPAPPKSFEGVSASTTVHKHLLV